MTRASGSWDARFNPAREAFEQDFAEPKRPPRDTHHPLQLVVLGLVAACADEGQPDATASVVVGLTSDLAVGSDVERVEVTMRIEGEVVRKQDLRHGESQLQLPEEFWFDRVPHESTIDIAFDAYAKDAAAPILRQRGSTLADSGRTPLLELSLNSACIDVACDLGAACFDGVCTSVERSPASLPVYDPSWIDDAPDACRTAASTPVLELGEGRDSYTPLEDGATLALEAGTQGGHHVWLALRAFGFRQLGSVAEVRGTLTALDREVPGLVSVLTFHRVEGVCEVHGLRFRVDGELTVEELLGQPLRIELTVSDPTGTSETATLDVLLADVFAPEP